VVPALLKGSREELRSAFSNLVSNAVRYTPEGGRIVLRWMMRDGKGVFSVEDSGIGIPEEHLPRLTERFYRVDRGRSRESGGTGLGLSIVKHVLLRHQASLEIVRARRRQHLQRGVPGLARPGCDRRDAFLTVHTVKHRRSCRIRALAASTLTACRRTVLPPCGWVYLEAVGRHGNFCNDLECCKPTGRSRSGAAQA
jgi:anti-sigma regulatory factor (Ser/Thr protein kinase)